MFLPFNFDTDPFSAISRRTCVIMPATEAQTITPATTISSTPTFILNNFQNFVMVSYDDGQN